MTNERPTVESFSVSPEEVAAGGDVTLEWQTSNATSGTITADEFSYMIPEADLASGSTTVEGIDAETTFTLTIRNGARQDVEVATVTVADEDAVPAITSFEADPSSVEAGDEVTLSWEVTGANSGVLTGGAEEYVIPTVDLDEGTFTTNLEEDTTFTLTMTNEFGDDTATVMVAVTATEPPTIVSFEADGDTIASGNSANLSYQVTDATSVEVRDGDDNVVFTSSDAAEAAMGSFDVTPAASTTYTLEATNAAGSTTSDPLSIVVVDPPTIVSFTASETDDIVPGSSVDLSWEVEDVDTLILRDGDGMEQMLQSDAGSTTVTVDATTSYTLKATNIAGTVTEMVALNVLGGPTIVDFSTPQTMDIPLQTDITLNWEVTGADTITVRDSGGNVLATSTMGMSSTTVTVTRDETYTLEATNAAGTAMAMISVTVLRAPAISSFTASQTSNLVPGSTVDLMWSVMDADTITLDDGTGPVDVTADGGMRTVTVNADTTYTLEATNASGSTSQVVSVTLLPTPSINSFTATPNTDVVPDSVNPNVDLAWSVSGADSITITDGVSATPITTSMMSSGMVSVAVDTNTTFTLEATNAAGSTTTTVQVTILGSPTVSSFSASQATDIVPGDTIDLMWSVTGANTITLDDGTGPVDVTADGGMRTVTVNADTTYTLAATNATGTTTATVPVTVLEPPTIGSFSTAMATGVTPGTSITLDWMVTGSDTITLDDGTGPSDVTGAGGSTSVTIDADTTYTLEATNAAGSTTQTLDVTVAAPVINSFMASETTDVLNGSSVDLSWDVVGATSIVIEGPNSTVIASGLADTGTQSVTITDDVTYVLKATNNAGVTTDSVAITLADPVISSFSASQTSGITPGNTIDLMWSVTGADTITLDDGTGPVDVTADGGMSTVTVNADTTYTLEATNNAGAVTDMLSVTVMVAAPTITSFSASDTTDIVPGDTIDLMWSVMNATTITLDDGTGPVDVTADGGMRTVTVNADTTYTLEATNAGGTVTDTLLVEVLDPPTITSFSASQTSGITPGNTIDLMWSVTGADTITLDDGTGPVDVTADGGMSTVTVNADTTYTLEATNAAGSVTDMVSVTVTTGPVPTIVDLDVDNPTVVSGGRVQIDWLTQDATSLTITDDQGGSPYSVPGADIDIGSYVVNPQVTTVYTLEATNANGTVTSTVTVTVTAASLLISEVFYDASGADADKEWVEIFNAGETFVDLSNYSLGVGGSDYTSNTYQFNSIVIPPRGTVVVGGPTSDASNYSPTFAQSDSFDTGGGIQNGGSASDGVALFFDKATNITASTVPIDAVVYGSPNTNNLLGDDGNPVADADTSPEVPSDSTLVRTSSSSDIFSGRSVGTPNLPVEVTSLTPSRGPNESAESITIEGFGFAADLDEIMLGNTTLNCVDVGPDQLLCDLMLPNSDTGLVDLTITRVNEYVPDPQAANGRMISALPAADQRTYTLTDAFFFEGQIPDPGNNFFCAVLDPSPTTVTAGSDLTVTVKVYEQSVTPTPNSMPPSNWRVQAAYFDRGVNPFEIFAPWVDYNPANVIDDPSFSNDDLIDINLNSSTARKAEVGFRISLDNGVNWIYCDALSGQNGSDDGWQKGVDVEWN